MSAERKQERTYHLGNVLGTRAFRPLFKEIEPISEGNHWNSVNLEVLSLDDCFAHGGEDIRPRNTTRINNVERRRGCRLCECDFENGSGHFFSSHPRDKLEHISWVYANGRMQQTGLTPRASGSAPSTILDLTRMGNQSVVAREPFDPPAIWPIRRDVAWRPLLTMIYSFQGFPV